MKKLPNSFFFAFFVSLMAGLSMSCSPVFGQNSVLASGKWYKVGIQKNGVYKISSKTFKKMGFDLTKTDPKKIKIYGNEGGMLPQPNQTSRPTDLTESAIFVSGENDGAFNSSDYILFYAQGPDKSYYHEGRETFYYEKNLYSDKNYYFITVAETNGKRIASADVLPETFPVVSEFENFVYHELDEYSELESGREWFGERFDLTPTLSINLSLKNIVAGSSLTLVSNVMAQSFSGSSFNVSLNGITIGPTLTVLPIPNSQYGIKGQIRVDTLSFTAASILAEGRSSQEIKFQYNKAPSGKSVGFLNYFLLQAKQKLALYGNQTIFSSTASLQNPTSRFQIDDSQQSARVWDISNPYEPLLQPSSFTSGKTSFSVSTNELKEFIIFSADVPSPDLIGSVDNQNIHGRAVPELLIVTHPDFLTQATRLAAYKSDHNISSTVVTTTEVYHEFSSGRQDVTAIRDLVKMFYDKSPGTLKAVLILGKGSYDYKTRIVDNKNFVPTYESRNSLHPLETYSSDDYFGFLQDHEGLWSESPAINHTLDISVGRLPVKTLTECKNVVDKIIRYETDYALRGAWQKEMVFIADDGDGNLHTGDANDLAETIDENHSEFNTKKIYLDQFPQISRPAGEISPETNEAIQAAFDRGTFLINYTGHGGELLLAQEKIFDALMIQKLENEKLPLLVTATCEFGRIDNPSVISGAELCLLRKEGGAIALVSTGRPVNAGTNFLLNEAFMDAFFQQENNLPLSLGEIFRRTKNNSASGVANRNFSLIGDPSLRLAIPQRKINITEVLTLSGSGILKSLSTVVVKGEVMNAAETDVDANFKGVLEATLFDKETSFQTLGDENAPFTYSQWYNALFRGKDSVKNGAFEFRFVVPKNIAYSVGEGKLSVYARDPFQNLEASGYSQNFQVGLSEPNPAPDNDSPIIKVFIGDTTFIDGGTINPNANLVARLYDSNGINISGYGIGNSITAILDNTQSFILNDFYTTDIGDYTAGTIIFPLKNISPGKHTLTVKAWDTHNNPSQATIEFIVSESEALIIESFGGYPNPFPISTKLFFTHNRIGDDLQASLTLYDYTGQVIQTAEFSIPASTYKVELLELTKGVNFIKNRPGGLYFGRLSVRSLTNGSKNEQVTKLILSN